MAVIEASATGGKWSATTAWVGGVVPTAADDVVFGEKSGSVEITEAALCRSLESKATYKGSLSHVNAIVLKIGTSTVNGESFIIKWLGGSYTIISGNPTISFGSTSATQVKLFLGTMKLPLVKFTGKGSYLLEEPYNCLQTTTIEECTFNSNGKEVSAKVWESSNALTRTINIENSVIKLTGTGTVWTQSTKTGLTFKAAGSTIEITDTTVTSKSFIPGAEVKYGKLKLPGSASSPICRITQSCTFTTLEFTEGQKAKLELTSSIKITVETLIAKGASGKVIIIEAVTVGTAFEFLSAKGEETFSQVDWVSLKDSHANTATVSRWFAGANSTNVSGNEGWKFEALKHEHTLTAEQPQTITRSEGVERTLTVSQPQSPSFNRGVARIMPTISQGQSVTQPRNIGRVLTVSQGQSNPTVKKELARALTVSQGQTVTKRSELARVLAASQGQSVTQSRVIGRVLAVSQGQSATRRSELARTLTVSQGSSISKAASIVRALSATQIASCSMSKAISRAFSVAQGQEPALARRIELHETLTVSQEVTVTAGRAFTETLSLEQGQSATITHAQPRTLAVEQAQAAALAKALGRTLTASQSQSATAQRAQTVGLSTAQGQSASLHGLVERGLSTSQGATVVLARALSRTLLLAQGQTASVAGVVPVSLLPPFDMSAEVAEARDEASASAASTTVGGVETSESEVSVIG